MIKIKKISLIIFSLIGVLNATDANDLASGKARIANIMSNADSGIAAYNKKNIHAAETQNIAKDLNIDQIAEFFNCKTVIGKNFLVETLSCPVSPQDKESVLKNRQDAIKILVENPGLKKEIEKLLDIAKAHEQEIITLMSDFFVGKTCPELKQLELLRTQNPALAPAIEFLHLNPTGKVVSTALNILSLTSATGLMARCLYTAYYNALAGRPWGLNVGAAIYFNLIGGMVGYTTYKDYANAREKRNKMHSLNQFIDIAEKFEKLCKTNSLQIQFKVSAIKDAQGVQLIEKLKHARYKAKNSLLFMTPQVHSFLYEVYKQEKYLSELFACIAEIDAYNAIASKLLHSGNAQNQFCFVEFKEKAKPSINAQEFWNVLVQNAVPSSISENKHIILTGPNAGGKTTAIRAILQNIILGQSFGVAAAKTFNMTMFDIIHSYLNISDDILQGLSLYASEVKRAQAILERIKSLEPDKKFFFALDELFTGTVAEDGEAVAYEFVKRISEFEHVQFIYATHFNKLKELGNNGTLCANYKVDAPTKNEQGKLVYPFTLSPGANESRVAIDLAREANLFN